jgi:hypothetical protein
MDAVPQLLVTTHLISTLLMVGVIWTVQIVHYPLMALVGTERFATYEAAHAPRMAAVVLLPWSVQGVTVAWLLLIPTTGVARGLVWASAIAAIVPVIVTVAVSVPAHRTLADGFDDAVHRRLVRTNWLRTAGWSAHGVFAVGLAITAG